MHTPSASSIYHILPQRFPPLTQLALPSISPSSLVLCLVVAASTPVSSAPSSPPSSQARGPSLSPRALSDKVYLPAQIGGIVGSYALCLVLVATALLALAKTRRKRLEAADELEDDDGTLKLPSFDDLAPIPAPDPSFSYPVNGQEYPYPTAPALSPRNFSYPALASPTRTEQSFHTYAPSPTSTIIAPGVDLSVDQNVVAADRQMAQTQLEDMYRLVMEQEAAKEAGVKFEAPPMPAARLPPPQHQASASTGTLTKKERFKPASLNLSKEDKPHSRTASILSALKSPLKKKSQVQGISISSPIMTPMTGTFPRAEGEELRTIPPRQYAPAAPPPVPTDQPYHQQQHSQPRRVMQPLTPDMSPDSTQSIDERLGGQLADASQHRRQLPLREHQQNHHHNNNNYHSRNVSTVTTEVDPQSATSERSTTPLVGLPQSPKPGMSRFPSGSLALPSSPKPGATFQRSGAPSAVRTGGALPLRAYEPALASPGLIARTTKETTFERAGPLSPNGQRTPFTGAAVPYSPYQPFSPVIPMTPSLVTRADRKRMRKLEPKTPTLEMVKSESDIW
ncbi:hypothetical protein GGTG_00324 [Gaeumannomyces tritici R3-111a-1]|uniref:Uncharacterized protein n=1 Tax=Gaeumannomyces tritici (strain R3-111a-1) TaxID=644352 RepID=J3NGD3_GAET3|nr:hypothetical protein GGTG_00324 [Gaeumannomyces tritici R3-111a-1]EJT80323.1 hypothetical protein GGTG_00324 [Gaeumannomyces tritici R3-111a-1]